MYVFNEAVAEMAIRMALPTIKMMQPIGSWGPKGVVIGVEGPGLEEPFIRVMKELEEDPEYKDRIEDFRQNVLAKLRPTRRTGHTSRHVLHEDPAALHLDDTLYPGSAVEGSVRVAASGWYGEADEDVSWIVWNCVHFICRMIAKRMMETDHAFVRDALLGARIEIVTTCLDGWRDTPLIQP